MSSDDVASSRISTAGSARNARANATSCRWPAESLPAGAPVTLGIRPEHAEPGNTAQHLVRTVQWQERLGETTYLYLDSGVAGEPMVVKAPGHAHAAQGQRVAVVLPAAALHLFDEHGHALPRCIADPDLQLPQAA